MRNAWFKFEYESFIVLFESAELLTKFRFIINYIFASVGLLFVCLM